MVTQLSGEGLATRGEAGAQGPSALAFHTPGTPKCGFWDGFHLPVWSRRCTQSSRLSQGRAWASGFKPFPEGVGGPRHLSPIQVDKARP